MRCRPSPHPSASSRLHPAQRTRPDRSPVARQLACVVGPLRVGAEAVSHDARRWERRRVHGLPVGAARRSGLVVGIVERANTDVVGPPVRECEPCLGERWREGRAGPAHHRCGGAVSTTRSCGNAVLVSLGARDRIGLGRPDRRQLRVRSCELDVSSGRLAPVAASKQVGTSVAVQIGDGERDTAPLRRGWARVGDLEARIEAGVIGLPLVDHEVAAHSRPCHPGSSRPPRRRARRHSYPQ